MRYTALVLALWAGLARSQGPLARLSNALSNPSFEQGTSGWRVTIGPDGKQGEDRWQTARSRGDRLDAEKKGWHNALADPWGATLLLWDYAQAHPNDPLTERLNSCLGEAFGAAGGRRGLDFAFYEGDAALAVANQLSAGLRDAFSMAAHGSFAYHPHTGNKMFSQAQSKSIGRDGEVIVGTCVMGLEPLARRALLIGDALLVRQLEKGLAYADAIRERR